MWRPGDPGQFDLRHFHQKDKLHLDCQVFQNRKKRKRIKSLTDSVLISVSFHRELTTLLTLDSFEFNDARGASSKDEIRRI